MCVRKLILPFVVAWGLSAGAVPPATSVSTSVVAPASRYNSWPMVQALGDRLVCAYSRGNGHWIGTGERGVWTRVSDDGGKTWSAERLLTNDPRWGEVTIGKGLDEQGAMLLWVRCWGKKDRHHDLYRTTDGVTFEKIATPKLDPVPMQITDIVRVPGGGLMSLWFSDGYRHDADRAWGTLRSADNGRTWESKTVERGLAKADWPTEPSAVWLDADRILVIARSEGETRHQFQIVSSDGGKTWQKSRTNITDVQESTPSLLFDATTGRLTNYYYQRGARQLKRRTVSADRIFTRPTEWPEPEVLYTGRETRPYDAGNANATRLKGKDFVATYTGNETNTEVVVVSVAAPVGGDFVQQRFVVSDTNRFTCGSGSVSCLSPDRTRILAPYLASTNGFGECHELVAIADIPVGSPELSASYDLCAAGDVFAGETVTNVLGFTPFLWKDRLRVFLDVNYSRFGYRDWDPSARKVVGEGIFKCRAGKGAPVEPLTPAAISRFLTDLGLTEFDPCKERGDRCIFQSKPQWIGNAFYGFVTSSCSQPILFRCADGETFEFIGAIPTICAYECQFAALNGVFYAVMRGAAKDNFWTSADGGRTWRPNGRLPDGLQRPQMLTWRNQVLIGYSAPDERPCRIRNGRNNLHLLVGEGTDLSRYREILHAADPIGIVYPDIVDIDGALHLLWSNSERFPTHVKWGEVQGKDQLLYGRLSLP